MTGGFRFRIVSSVAVVVLVSVSVDVTVVVVGVVCVVVAVVDMLLVPLTVFKTNYTIKLTSEMNNFLKFLLIKFY